MSKKKMAKSKKKRITYSKEIEAAWYVLKGFTSNFDYVVRYTDVNGKKQIVTVNPNCVLASKLSKYKFFKPHSISKSMFESHFRRDRIIFYKSSPNSKLTTGYGRYDQNAKSLSFSQELNITSRRVADSKYYILLIGIDIDCHNGEKHVREVEELIKKYLPDTYWEDSTNGKGRHGYFKIKYIKSFGVIKKITPLLNDIFAGLNNIKNKYGYEANIDEPAGLPYILNSEYTNPYNREWTTLFAKSKKKDKFLGNYINPKSSIWISYIDYLKINNFFIGSKIVENPNKLTIYLTNDQIKTTFSEFLKKNDILFSAPTKNKKFYNITYQRAIKLPLFNSDTDYYGNLSIDMDSIEKFHKLRYYTSGDLIGTYNNIKRDMDILNLTVNPDLISNTKNQVTQISNELINISLIKKKEEDICNNCACTITQNNVVFPNLEPSLVSLATVIEWSDVCTEDECQEVFDIEDFWNKKNQNETAKNKTKYKDKIENLKTEKNTMKKTALFITAYINEYGKIPTVDQAEDEYVRLGLNNNAQISTVNRRNRINGCIKYYSDSYDKNKIGFNLCWKTRQSDLITFLLRHFPEKMTYKQGSRIKNIIIEEVGFVYYIIVKMGELDQDYVMANSLSYKRVDDLFMDQFGHKCGRHKFSAILKTLLENNLIKKVGNYKIGLRGNCYSIVG